MTATSGGAGGPATLAARDPGGRGDASATYLAVGYPFGPILLSFFVAAYTGVRYGAMTRPLPVSLVALGLLTTHVFTNSAALASNSFIDGNVIVTTDGATQFQVAGQHSGLILIGQIDEG